MEDLDFKQTKTGIHIEGFPDAVKVVQITGKKAKRLADLTLHRADLTFAMEYLEGINLLPRNLKGLRRGLWHSAIAHFMKCFVVHKSRFSLNPKLVYKGNQVAMVVFENFKSLRNKHLVHDENSYTQSHPGAILNKKECDHQIAKIVCMAWVSVTLDQVAYSNLHRSITHALEWVEEQIDDLCKLLTSELEPLPYDDLFSLKEVVFSPPKIEEINKPRATPSG